MGKPPRKVSARRSNQLYPHILIPHPKSFLHAVLNVRFVAVFVVLLFVTNWLEHRWILDRASLAGTDTLLGVAPTKPAQFCRLITIDEKDFDTYLGETLEPQKLSNVIKTILEYEPAVLVVDIDTSALRFSHLEVPTNKRKTVIVWARVSHQEEKYVPGQRVRAYAWAAGEVLGNRPDQPQFVGSPLFPQDPDLVVRGFQRKVRLDANAQSLHWVAVAAYCKGNARPFVCAEANGGNHSDPQINPTDERVRPFRENWDFISLPLEDVMVPDAKAKHTAGALGEIVLLGASFADIHPSLFGPKLGIELTASAIETELAGDSRPIAIAGLSQWVVKIFLGFTIVWLNHRLMPLWATAGTLSVLAVVFLLSFLGIYYNQFHMDFLPFMVGIWIEQLVEAAQRAQQNVPQTLRG